MIYAMSDIHGCLMSFDQALELVDLSGDNKLVLLGDYIHGGEDNFGVLERIMNLQRQYGREKVIALLGNHEEMAMEGFWKIKEEKSTQSDNIDYDDDEREDLYLSWMEGLPLYYTEGKTIFCHAGIDEEAGEMWEFHTDEYTFTNKFPPQLGKFHGNMTIVAGHVGTAEIAQNPRFHDIYFDGESHYYIDGTVLDSGEIPVLAVDTEKDEYYAVTESGMWLVEPYDEN